MKKYLNSQATGLGGELGGVFASRNWLGGGGASFVEMTMIAVMLVHGMLIYSGGGSGHGCGHTWRDGAGSKGWSAGCLLDTYS